MAQLLQEEPTIISIEIMRCLGYFQIGRLEVCCNCVCFSLKRSRVGHIKRGLGQRPDVIGIQENSAIFINGCSCKLHSSYSSLVCKFINETGLQLLEMNNYYFTCVSCTMNFKMSFNIESSEWSSVTSDCLFINSTEQSSMMQSVGVFTYY